MKKIKFRAFCQVCNEMIDVMDNFFQYRDGIIIQCNNHECRTDTKIMQYVGLKDKNNKEIYELDIIIVDRLTDFTPDGYWVQPKGPAIPNLIIWDEDYCRFNVPHPSYHFEVIGNIYQNPELLEKRLNYE